MVVPQLAGGFGTGTVLGKQVDMEERGSWLAAASWSALLDCKVTLTLVQGAERQFCAAQDIHHLAALCL